MNPETNSNDHIEVYDKNSTATIDAKGKGIDLILGNGLLATKREKQEGEEVRLEFEIKFSPILFVKHLFI